jgi:4-amino-4-deoxy-L-arabinose transferase-like glycosyltransferase
MYGPLQSPAVERRAHLRSGILTAACAALALANAGWSAWDQGWTYDEAYHLLWSERLLDSGVTERASQERLNSKTPISIPNVLAHKAARAAGAAGERTLRLSARLPNVLWLGALLAVLGLVVRRRFGDAAAAVAVVGASLEPSLVAHASVVGSDLPFAVATLLAVAAGAAWADGPTTRRAAAFGAALGLALVAKVTAVLLLPGLAILPLLLRGGIRARGRRVFADAAAALFAAWLVVSGAYLFHEMGARPAALAPRSAAFQRLAAAVPGLPLPVPAAFLTAFDATMASDARAEWNSVLLGRRHPQGVWYYFLVVALVKTPLALLVAVVVGLVRAARDPSRRRDALLRLSAATAAWLLFYFSFVFRVQVGYRYVLLALPLVLVIAAAGLASLRPSRRWIVAGAAGLVLAVAENVLYFGNPLAFTNVAVQPKRLAYRVVADSNIDWGQNRERVGRWLVERRLTYTHLDPVHLLPGHNTVDLNTVAGVFDPESYRWVREHLRPTGHLGHTYLLYDVDEGTWREFLESARRRVPEPRDAELCPADRPYLHEPIGTKVPFALHENPPPGRTWVACFVAPRGMELALWVDAGGLEVGRFTSAATCETQPLVAGQEAWWKLEPGTHALCVVTPPNRRAWLPYRMSARWFLGGRQVLMDLRPLAPKTTPPPPEPTSPRSSSPPRPPAG